MHTAKLKKVAPSRYPWQLRVVTNVFVARMSMKKTTIDDVYVS